MRIFLLSFIISLLIVSCTTTKNNYYTQSVQSWRGANAKTLVSRWGEPDIQVQSPKGNQVFLYKKQSYFSMNNRPSADVAVNFNDQGKPMIYMPALLNRNGNGPMPACVAYFEVNKKGEIIDTGIKGNGCFATADIASKMANPTSEKKLLA